MSSADTAIRVGAAIGMSAEMWLGLQNAYDLEVARGRARMPMYVGSWLEGGRCGSCADEGEFVSP